MRPDEAFQRLKEGNGRFAAGQSTREQVDTVAKRVELARHGQNPFAVVLTCADSRVPAELVFDVGLGDLFVVRVAGNVVAPSLIASVEFAATNLGCPLVVVMGHTQCGAINAACQHHIDQLKEPSVNLADLIGRIKPAIEAAGVHDRASFDEEHISEVTRYNVKNSVDNLLAQSDILAKARKAGEIIIVGAIYNIESGEVEFFPTSNNPDKFLKRLVQKVGMTSVVF